METSEFVGHLRHDGALLAAAAEEAGWDAEVGSCPGWRMRDLVRHTGCVHRWAATFVAGRTSPAPLVESGPEHDGELGAWFRTGHRDLVARLAQAPADLTCWTFLAAPSPLAFWARRQAHETAVHRVDAESASGGGHSGIDGAFALDGIDELLAGFHTRSRSRVRTEAPRTLLVRATDPPGGAEGLGEWLIQLSQEPPRVERTDGAGADCVVSGPAAGLYVALWNRSGFEQAEVEVSGDGSLAALWQRTSAV